MTSVFAPLVDAVEEVDDEEVEPGRPMQPRIGIERVLQVDVLVDVPVEVLVDVLVDVPVEVLVEVLVDVEPPVSARPVTPSTISPTRFDPEPLEELEFPELPEVLVLPLPPLGSSARTEADATPCQIMPTSIIPAATAAIRLTVVRRPGLISTLFPSN